MMTYEEFEKAIKKIDSSWKVVITEDYLKVKDCLSDTLMNIGTEGALDSSWNGFLDLPLETRKQLVEASVKMAFTPLEDRVPAKKYLWRLKGFNDYTYLNHNLLHGFIVIDDSSIKENGKNHFTEKEFLALSEKFGFCADAFEKEEI